MSHTILRLSQVRVKTALSRSTIYNKINSGDFPKPITLGERAIGFLESEIDDWIESRITISRREESV